jgi:hypothetical protein
MAAADAARARSSYFSDGSGSSNSSSSSYKYKVRRALADEAVWVVQVTLSVCWLPMVRANSS